MKTKDPKGTVIGYVLVAMVMLLAIGGIAVDIAGQAESRNELHRTTDAAALAGAGSLLWDKTAFPAVRQNAVFYGGQNPTRFGTVTLNPNPTNDPAGDVVIGIWNGTAFSPWDQVSDPNGVTVNAVQCRSSQTMPTWFLRMIGMTSLGVTAHSVAIAPVPNQAPSCVLPIGVTTCQFFNGTAFSSLGCGTAITFTTSSGHITGTTSGTNTAAWINLDGGNANGPYLISAINAAANGTCTSNPVAGQTVNANNGMQNDVMDTFTNDFVSVYNSSPTHTIKDANGNPTYTGKGWEVYVPLINTGCPPTSINQSYTIETFSKFIFTQVIHHKACMVNNPNDGNSAYVCANPSDPSFPNEAIFGYFDCASLTTTPSPIPAPRAALATRIMLVQ